MNIFIYCFTVLFAVSVGNTGGKLHAQTDQRVKDYIDDLKKDQDFKNSLFCVKVVNATSKKAVVDYQSHLRMVPASIQKLVTTGAGFIVLGKNHTFGTRLAYGGVVSDSCLFGSLHIIGGGDPSFGSNSFPYTISDSVFSYFLNSLKHAGINRINGDIVADASYLDNERVHSSWEWEDLGYDYGAGTSGLSFCENAFNVLLTADNTYDSVQVSFGYPFLNTEYIQNNVRPVPKDSVTDIRIFSSPLSGKYLLSGSIAASGKQVKAYAALQNPPLTCAKQLLLYLQANGVIVEGTAVQQDLQTARFDNLQELATWVSVPYSELAKNTNAYSNNVFADMILKHLGKQYGASGFEQSTDELKKVLKRYKLPVEQIKIVDGSGLSRQNLLTADFMCEYLSIMEKQSPDFVRSIPVPGERGTFLNFMSSYNIANRKRVRLKSGSMTGVVNYAGYIKNKNKETQYVTIMVNNFTCKASVIRRKLEKLVYLLSD